MDGPSGRLRVGRHPADGDDQSGRGPGGSDRELSGALHRHVQRTCHGLHRHRRDARSNTTGGTLTPTVSPTREPARVRHQRGGRRRHAVGTDHRVDPRCDGHRPGRQSEHGVVEHRQRRSSSRCRSPSPSRWRSRCRGTSSKDADPNQSGAVVTYPAPTTTGGTAPVAVSCSHASGAFYPIGVTTVTCTATDAARRMSPCRRACVTSRCGSWLPSRHRGRSPSR